MSKFSSRPDRLLYKENNSDNGVKNDKEIKQQQFQPDVPSDVNRLELAVQEIVETGVSVRSTCLKYGLDRTNIRRRLQQLRNSNNKGDNDVLKSTDQNTEEVLQPDKSVDGATTFKEIIQPDVQSLPPDDKSLLSDENRLQLAVQEIIKTGASIRGTCQKYGLDRSTLKRNVQQHRKSNPTEDTNVSPCKNSNHPEGADKDIAPPINKPAESNQDAIKTPASNLPRKEKSKTAVVPPDNSQTETEWLKFILKDKLNDQRKINQIAGTLRQSNVLKSAFQKNSSNKGQFHQGAHVEIKNVINSKGRLQGNLQDGQTINQSTSHLSTTLYCTGHLKETCSKGKDCLYSHNNPPLKLRLCEQYLWNHCLKKDDCPYLHQKFPCKSFQNEAKCIYGDECIFSHEPLNWKTIGLLYQKKFTEEQADLYVMTYKAFEEFKSSKLKVVNQHDKENDSICEKPIKRKAFACSYCDTLNPIGSENCSICEKPLKRKGSSDDGIKATSSLGSHTSLSQTTIIKDKQNPSLYESPESSQNMSKPFQFTELPDKSTGKTDLTSNIPGGNSEFWNSFKKCVDLLPQAFQSSKDESENHMLVDSVGKLLKMTLDIGPCGDVEKSSLPLSSNKEKMLTVQGDTPIQSSRSISTGSPNVPSQNVASVQPLVKQQNITYDNNHHTPSVHPQNVIQKQPRVVMDVQTPPPNLPSKDHLQHPKKFSLLPPTTENPPDLAANNALHGPNVFHQTFTKIQPPIIDVHIRPPNLPSNHNFHTPNIFPLDVTPMQFPIVDVRRPPPNLTSNKTLQNPSLFPTKISLLQSPGMKSLFIPPDLTSNNTLHGSNVLPQTVIPKQPPIMDFRRPPPNIISKKTLQGPNLFPNKIPLLPPATESLFRPADLTSNNTLHLSNIPSQTVTTNQPPIIDVRYPPPNIISNKTLQVTNLFPIKIQQMQPTGTEAQFKPPDLTSNNTLHGSNVTQMQSPVLDFRHPPPNIPSNNTLQGSNVFPQKITPIQSQDTVLPFRQSNLTSVNTLHSPNAFSQNDTPVQSTGMEAPFRPSNLISNNKDQILNSSSEDENKDKKDDSSFSRELSKQLELFKRLQHHGTFDHLGSSDKQSADKENSIWPNDEKQKSPWIPEVSSVHPVNKENTPWIPGKEEPLMEEKNAWMPLATNNLTSDQEKSLREALRLVDNFKADKEMSIWPSDEKQKSPWIDPISPGQQKTLYEENTSWISRAASRSPDQEKAVYEENTSWISRAASRSPDQEKVVYEKNTSWIPRAASRSPDQEKVVNEEKTSWISRAASRSPDQEKVVYDEKTSWISRAASRSPYQEKAVNEKKTSWISRAASRSPDQEKVVYEEKTSWIPIASRKLDQEKAVNEKKTSWIPIASSRIPDQEKAVNEEKTSRIPIAASRTPDQEKAVNEEKIPWLPQDGNVLTSDVEKALREALQLVDSLKNLQSVGKEKTGWLSDIPANALTPEQEQVLKDALKLVRSLEADPSSESRVADDKSNDQTATEVSKVKKHSEKLPCKFIYSGNECRQGNKCRFSHGPSNEETADDEIVVLLEKKVICKSVYTGDKCKQGSKCRFSHESLKEETTHKPRDEKKIMCKSVSTGEKCKHGSKCRFSHESVKEKTPHKPREERTIYRIPCKSVFTGEKCRHGFKCIYSHEPVKEKSPYKPRDEKPRQKITCKSVYTGEKCRQGSKCRFSHEPVREKSPHKSRDEKVYKRSKSTERHLVEKKKGGNSYDSSPPKRAVTSAFTPDWHFCKFFLQGRCNKGDNCRFTHPEPKKKELCKSYLKGTCPSEKKCPFIHQKFLCKFFFSGAICKDGDNCQYSHKSVDVEILNLLEKFLDNEKADQQLPPTSLESQQSEAVDPQKEISDSSKVIKAKPILYKTDEQSTPKSENVVPVPKTAFRKTVRAPYLIELIPPSPLASGNLAAFMKRKAASKLTPNGKEKSNIPNTAPKQETSYPGQIKKSKFEVNEKEKISHMTPEQEFAYYLSQKGKEKSVLADDKKEKPLPPKMTPGQEFAFYLSSKGKEKSNLASDEEEKTRLANEEKEKARLANELKEKARRLIEEKEKSRRLDEEIERARRLIEEKEKARRLNQEIEKAKHLNEEKEKNRLANEEKEKIRLANQEKEKVRRANEEKEKVRRANEEKEKVRRANEEKEKVRRANEEKEKARRANEEKEKVRRANEEKEKVRRANEEKEKVRRANEEKEKARCAVDKEDTRYAAGKRRLEHEMMSTNDLTSEQEDSYLYGEEIRKRFKWDDDAGKTMWMPDVATNITSENDKPYPFGKEISMWPNDNSGKLSWEPTVSSRTADQEKVVTKEKTPWIPRVLPKTTNKVEAMKNEKSQWTPDQEKILKEKPQLIPMVSSRTPDQEKTSKTVKSQWIPVPMISPKTSDSENSLTEENIASIPVSSSNQSTPWMPMAFNVLTSDEDKALTEALRVLDNLKDVYTAGDEKTSWLPTIAPNTLTPEQEKVLKDALRLVGSLEGFLP